MKAGDVLTLALIGLAFYLLWRMAREVATQPRSYYASGTLDNTYL
jgi:hypothetical protein